MDLAIRIKHYIDGYERLIGPSDYDLWCKTEQKIGKPIFKVIGIIVNNKYISLEKNKGGQINV